ALIRLFAAYAQAPHTPIAEVQLFLFHAGANVIFVQRFVESSSKRRLFRAAACGVMASDGIPKGLGLGPEIVGDIGDHAAARVIGLSGVTEGFAFSKGYGFIVPDNGLPDILLHVTCLRRDGFQTAYEGARIVAEVLQRPKGLQCFRILSMDESTAVHPSTLP